MIKLILLLFTASFAHGATNKVVYCFHPKVCELASLTTTSLKIEPTSDQEILKTASFVILPSSELSQEAQKLTIEREKKGLHTIKIYLPTNLTKLYKIGQNLNDQELAQFWYFPDLTLGTAKLLCAQVELKFKHACVSQEQKLLEIQREISSYLADLRLQKKSFRTNSPFDLWLKRINLYSANELVEFPQDQSIFENFNHFITNLKKFSRGKINDNHQKN